MKKPNIIKVRLKQLRGLKRFLRKYRKHKTKLRMRPRRKVYPQKVSNRRYSNSVFSTNSQKNMTRECMIKKYLPVNLKYMLDTKDSPFYIKKVKDAIVSEDVIIVPKQFSIFENPKECFQMLRDLIHALLYTDFSQVILDYNKCESIDLCSQILLDIIFKDWNTFVTEVGNNHGIKATKLFPITVGGKNINNINVQKILFSVGSPANVAGREYDFPNIKKSKLCIHNRKMNRDRETIMAYKDIATTELADYVIDCLRSVNKKLTPERLDDLCIVIGETLINAEEHSTTGCRYSVGYFEELENDGKHYGMFRLVILNFGHTIYEKFKNLESSNVDVVKQMKSLSEQYTKYQLFTKRDFEEESLWTLYALQQGVTSVSADLYTQRGNGSINFINSFFNLKGDEKVDDVSWLSIASGRTRIVFDGAYKITSKNINGEVFQCMTFNKENDLRYKPDKKYVYGTDYYFPGTAISVNIMLSDDDIRELN